MVSAFTIAGHHQRRRSEPELLSLSYFLRYESDSKGLLVSGMHLALESLLVKRSETALTA